MDAEAAVLLEGLEGDERAAREQLLEWLLKRGVSVRELKAAAAEDRLALLPVEQLLGGRYTAREIEAQAGFPAQTVLRLRRLMGLPQAGPDDEVFDEEQIEAAKATRMLMEAGLGEEAIAEITRVLGEAMARLAATTAAAFADAFLEAGDSEQQVGVRFATQAEELRPAVGPVLLGAYSAHLRESIRRGIITRDELREGRLETAQEMTVAFADLVGFTRLSGELDAHELGTVAGKLAELATELTQPPVQLVKTIGDAAMFVSPEAPALVEISLGLCEAAEEADLPALRAGLASGPALGRAGDFYGHAVNLASRVTGIARPGSVLCTQEVREAAPERFRWSFAGRHRLKGVADAVLLHRARHLAPDAEQPPAQETPTSSKGRRSARSTRRRGDRPRRRGSS